MTGQPGSQFDAVWVRAVPLSAAALPPSTHPLPETLGELARGLPGADVAQSGLRLEGAGVLRTADGREIPMRTLLQWQGTVIGGTAAGSLRSMVQVLTGLRVDFAGTATQLASLQSGFDVANGRTGQILLWAPTRGLWPLDRDKKRRAGRRGASRGFGVAQLSYAQEDSAGAYDEGQGVLLDTADDGDPPAGVNALLGRNPGVLFLTLFLGIQ
ncbi:MAG: hypothetical protein EPN72_10635 [Nevskiaceae bacterium]|nr:MAG: hypothetical protein EPN63_05645 [Nevskiaceae bacterium]TBR72206.1 MAG: hypothetical protein EPN72_10635 [Nevskiaceae bacterium]